VCVRHISLDGEGNALYPVLSSFNGCIGLIFTLFATKYFQFQSKEVQRLFHHAADCPRPLRHNACASNVRVQLRVEAAYLYDAVWIYARAAHALVAQGYDPSDGRRILNHIKGTTYKST